MRFSLATKRRIIWAADGLRPAGSFKQEAPGPPLARARARVRAREARRPDGAAADGTPTGVGGWRATTLTRVKHVTRSPPESSDELGIPSGARTVA